MSNIITKLAELQKLHPEATVKFNVSEDTSFWEHSCLYVDECDSSVTYVELTQYKEYLVDMEELKENIWDELSSNDEYNDLTEGEFEELVECQCDKYKFDKCIVVRIG